MYNAIHRFDWPLTLLVTAMVLVAGCSSRDAIPIEGEADTTLAPDAEGRGITIYLYNRGQITAEIVSEVMVQYQELDSTMARMVDINAFDSSGQSAGSLVGDSAVIREKTGRMDIFGHVVFVAEDGTRLETEYLRWNPNTNEVETEAFVRISRGQDWATGWDFRADQDLQRWRILKDPRGTFYGTPDEDEL